jgi:hypothetical protein
MHTSFKLIVIAAAALAFCGCANIHTEAASTPPGQTKPAAGIRRAPVPAGLSVRAARFGSGTNVTDVTDRVVELLRTQPQGFTARADWFGVDPRPYKRKAIVILYEYRGSPQVLLATEERITFDLLIENAR